MVFVCIDIGGTNTLLGIGNGEFEIKRKIKSKEFLLNIEEKIQKLLYEIDRKPDEINKVLVAVAGPMDREKGEFYPPNFYEDIGLDKIQIKDPLEKFGKINIINDCTSAVIGEYEYGNHNTDNLVYVTISSGIGAGVILNGKLLEAADGNFGEIGHMKLGYDGLECGCGGKGHWEAYSSGNNMPKMAKELYNADFDDSLEIFEEYQKHNYKAEKTIAKMHEMNLKGVINLTNLFNPEKIILGGAVALNHPRKVIEPLNRKIDEEAINREPKIESCSLEQESVIHGLRAIGNRKNSVPQHLL